MILIWYGTLSKIYMRNSGNWISTASNQGISHIETRNSEQLEKEKCITPSRQYYPVDATTCFRDPTLIGMNLHTLHLHQRWKLWIGCWNVQKSVMICKMISWAWISIWSKHHILILKYINACIIAVPWIKSQHYRFTSPREGKIWHTMIIRSRSSVACLERTQAPWIARRSFMTIIKKNAAIHIR